MLLIYLLIAYSNHSHYGEQHTIMQLKKVMKVENIF